MPVCTSEHFPGGRTAQGVSGIGKSGREVLVPVFVVMSWSQARKEFAVGFRDIENRGDEDRGVVAML